MAQMNPCVYSEAVSRLIDGGVAASQTSGLFEHMGTCEACSTQHREELRVRRVESLNKAEERDRLLWVYGAAVIGGGLLGSVAAGPFGGLIGMAVGYLAFRTAHRGSP